MRTCAACGTSIEHRGPNARYCGDACRDYTPCPKCGGPMARYHSSETCRGCLEADPARLSDRGRRAGATRGAGLTSSCPTCNGPKTRTSKECRSCSYVNPTNRAGQRQLWTEELDRAHYIKGSRGKVVDHRRAKSAYAAQRRRWAKTAAAEMGNGGAWITRVAKRWGVPYKTANARVRRLRQQGLLGYPPGRDSSSRGGWRGIRST